MGDFNGHVGKLIDGFKGVHRGYGFGDRNMEGRMLQKFCDQKELCLANTCFKKGNERKITFRSGENRTEIDFLLVGKDQINYLKDVKVISGELQHGILVADVDGRKLKRPGMKNKNQLTRRRVWKLKEIEVGNDFKQRLEELVDMHSPDMWKTFKDGVLKACDEL